MRRIYHLSTCKTCQNIIKELNIGADIELSDIKKENISAEELDKAAKILGSFEMLFSKKSMKYKSLGLKDKVLTQNEMLQYILEEYTFLKRPLIIIGNEVFAGNVKATIEAAKKII